MSYALYHVYGGVNSTLYESSLNNSCNKTDKTYNGNNSITIQS